MPDPEDPHPAPDAPQPEYEPGKTPQEIPMEPGAPPPGDDRPYDDRASVPPSL